MTWHGMTWHSMAVGRAVNSFLCLNRSDGCSFTHPRSSASRAFVRPCVMSSGSIKLVPLAIVILPPTSALKWPQPILYRTVAQPDTVRAKRPTDLTTPRYLPEA